MWQFYFQVPGLRRKLWQQDLHVARRLDNAVKPNEADVRNREKSILVNNLQDSSCISTGKPSSWITTIINADTQDITVHYETDRCEAIITSQKPLPSDGFQLIDHVLKKDPVFLNRYQLDLLQSSDDWAQRLKNAVVNSEQESDVASKSLSSLLATDLLYYLPSARPPFGIWDDSWRVSEPRALAIRTPLDAMTAPLMNSPSGRDLAGDLASLQHFASHVQVAPPPVGLQLSDKYFAWLREVQQGAFTKVEGKADDEARLLVRKSIRERIQTLKWVSPWVLAKEWFPASRLHTRESELMWP